MKSKLKDLLYLIGYILVLIIAANAIFVKLQGGITFIPSIIAIIGLFAGGYGVFFQTKKLLDPKHNKIRKMLSIASPFIILIVWALIILQITYQQAQNDKYEIWDMKSPETIQEEINTPEVPDKNDLEEPLSVIKDSLNP